MNSADAIIIEVRAAEGGADAKLLVHQQLRAYLAVCTTRGL